MRTPIKTVEQEHPWLHLLYAVAIVATIAFCALLTGCGGGDPEDAALDASESVAQKTPIPVNCGAHPEACK